MLTERSVRFDAHEVLATLAGRKTQMRRVMRVQPTWDESRAEWRYESPRCSAGWSGDRPRACAMLIARDDCPYGVPGDRLWAKETFALSVRDPEAFERDTRNPTDWDGPVYRATHDGSGEWVRYGEDGKRAKIPAPWRPSIHMPRWASRITLEVTAVRVERLHDITEEDARAEGVMPGEPTPDDPTPRTALYNFRSLWCDARGWDAWRSNPWVWVVEFRRVAR